MPAHDPIPESQNPNETETDAELWAIARRIIAERYSDEQIWRWLARKGMERGDDYANDMAQRIAIERYNAIMLAKAQKLIEESKR